MVRTRVDQNDARWLVLALALLTAACTTTEVVGSIAGATVYGGRSPSHEIEQTYYVGIFDPADQVPPSLYRLTVRGQASFISMMRFASGWVPASVVDPLNGQVQLTVKNGELVVSAGEQNAVLTPDRRMVMFGPEGFRTAPTNSRLVIVMGSSPEEYFRAVDAATAAISVGQWERTASAPARRSGLVSRLLDLGEEQDAVDRLRDEFSREVTR